MYKFGKSSKNHLDTVDSRLQRICEEAIKVYDFTVTEGHRTNERQNQLFKQGASKLREGQSKHNSLPSKAVDVVPWPIDWKDRERFYYLAGIMKAIAHTQGVKLRWGGDWDQDNDFKDNRFDDLPHFEIDE